MSATSFGNANAPPDNAAQDALWAERFWTRNYRPGVPASIDDELEKWSSMAELFEYDSRRFADRPGYVSIGSTMTYGQMLEAAHGFAAWLTRTGVKPGDRVALMMPNCLQYPAALFGTLFAGAVVVNVNPLYTPRELKHQLADSGAVVIVVMNMFAHTVQLSLPGTAIRHVVVTAMGDMLGGIKGIAISAIMRHVQRMVPRYSLPGAVSWKTVMRQGCKLPHAPVSRRADDLAFLQYTGGTSGVAKGAMLTNRNVLANILQGRAWSLNQIDGEAQVTNVTLLPLYHIFSLTANLLMFVGVGGRNILIANPRDTKRVQGMLKKENFFGFTGINTLFASFLENEDFCRRDFSNLRMTVSGGMATQRDVAERWQKVTGKPLVEGYGLTECAPVVCVGYVDLDHPEKMGFTGKIGFPVSSTEVRMRRPDGSWCGIDEIGELCVRGPQVMAGYWNQPEETAQVLIGDGWLATGDVGVMDAEGQVKLVDRIKDMILVSGFNVYPSEIEDVIALHPDVREVAVIGVASGKQGEQVKAIVVPRVPTLTEADIIQHCRKSLTGYKIPRIVSFRSEELPKTNVGKVLRRALREAG